MTNAEMARISRSEAERRDGTMRRVRLAFAISSLTFACCLGVTGAEDEGNVGRVKLLFLHRPDAAGVSLDIGHLRLLTQEQEDSFVSEVADDCVMVEALESGAKRLNLRAEDTLIVCCVSARRRNSDDETPVESPRVEKIAAACRKLVCRQSILLTELNADEVRDEGQLSATRPLDNSILQLLHSGEGFLWIDASDSVRCASEGSALVGAFYFAVVFTDPSPAEADDGFTWLDLVGRIDGSVRREASRFRTKLPARSAKQIRLHVEYSTP